MKTHWLALGSLSVIGPLSFFACGGGDTQKPVETPPKPSVTAPDTASAPASASASAPASASASAPTSNIDAFGVARTLLEGFNQQNAQKYQSAYAADATIMVPGLPDVKGADAIQADHQKLFTAFPDTRMSGARLFAKDDVAVMEFVISASQQGDWMGVKAAQKPVGVRGVSVMWFSPDGAIKKEDRYYDVATMLGQVGGLKGKWRGVPLAPAQMKGVSATRSAAETANVELVKKFFASLQAKNEADFLGTQNDAIELDDLTRSQSYLGTVDTKKMFDTWTKSVPDLKVQVASAWGFGDFVVVETVTTGKQTGPIDGAPASGKQLTLHQASVMQCKDGKILRGWTYGNGLEAQQQMGLYKLPGAAAGKPGGK